MTIVNKATLKRGPELRQLSLFRVEPKVFRWVYDSGGVPVGELPDYIEAPDAIRGLRGWVENDAGIAGWDLSICPVAPPPDERAANGITGLFDRSMRETGQFPTIDEIAEIVRNETAIIDLIERITSLVAYEITRLRRPKPPGLDMAHAGILLGVLEAIERATCQDLSGLKDMIPGDISQVKVYANIPPAVKP